MPGALRVVTRVRMWQAAQALEKAVNGLGSDGESASGASGGPMKKRKGKPFPQVNIPPRPGMKNVSAQPSALMADSDFISRCGLSRLHTYLNRGVTLRETQEETDLNHDGCVRVMFYLLRSMWRRCLGPPCIPAYCLARSLRAPGCAVSWSEGIGGRFPVVWCLRYKCDAFWGAAVVGRHDGQWVGLAVAITERQRCTDINAIIWRRHTHEPFKPHAAGAAITWR